jgi:carbamoyl-phosphate synthase large subunit
MSKPQYTIAVSGLNNIDSPGPGMPVIRALREAESFTTRIIGLSYDAFEPGLYMEGWVDYAYQIPFPSSGQEILMNRIRQIHAIEKIDILIPNFDAELFCFIRLAERLEKELGIKTVLPEEQSFEERHKANLSSWGEKHQIPVPPGKMIHSVYEIPAVASQYGYPLVIKGKYYEAGIAYSYDQAVNWFHKISAKWGLPIIAQKFLTGTEVNVTALGDGKGNMIGAVPMRKQVITDKGKAWAGVTLEDEKMLAFARHLFRQTCWKGPCELEMIRTKEGELFLIELNPRFPAWVYLAVGAGQNHPEALVNMAMGKEVIPFNTYASGKMFIRYSWDMIVDMKDFEQISVYGELGLNKAKN